MGGRIQDTYYAHMKVKQANELLNFGQKRTVFGFLAPPGGLNLNAIDRNTFSDPWHFNGRLDTEPSCNHRLYFALAGRNSGGEQWGIVLNWFDNCEVKRLIVTRLIAAWLLLLEAVLWQVRSRFPSTFIGTISFSFDKVLAVFLSGSLDICTHNVIAFQGDCWFPRESRGVFSPFELDLELQLASQARTLCRSRSWRFHCRLWEQV
jgi:hypothetical protein